MEHQKGPGRRAAAWPVEAGWGHPPDLGHPVHLNRQPYSLHMLLEESLHLDGSSFATIELETKVCLRND